MTDYLKLAAESPEPTAPTGANPYLDLVKQDQMAEQARARSMIEMALKDNPDVAAERQRLAKTSGLPLQVIERNLDEVRLKEQARAIDLLKMAQDSPVLARQMTDPTFTTLAIDDVDTLTEIERSVGHAVRYMMGAAPGGGVVGDLKASLYRSAGAFAGAKRAAVDVVEPWARLVAGDDNWFAGMSRYYAEQIKANDAVAESLSPRTGSTFSDGVSAGVQSFGQNVKYTPLALAGPGGAVLALGGMVMESFGTSYGKAADKNLPLWQKLGYASSDAMIEYWTEKIPMDALVGGIRQGAPFIQVLAKQLALEIPGEQLATVLQDLNEWATLNPGKPFADYLKERPDAAAQTLIATVIGTGGNVAVTSGAAKIADSIAGPAWRDNLTKTYADMLSEQLKLAGQSLLRERSPEDFRAYVQTLGDKPLYVDGEVLNQLPAEVLNQLPESVREQIADAAATGDTVEIPMADVLTVAPGTPLEQVLNEHARMDPFASSKAEVAAAQDVLKQEAERVIQQAADAQVAQQEFDTVKAMYAEQIAATGRYRPAVAEQMGTWVASFYTAYGSRVGMTPTQFQQRYPVRVAGAPSAEQGEVMDQGQALTPEMKAWFDEPGPENTMVNEDGTPRVLYHGTTKANVKGMKALGEIRRSETGAMGPGIYLGDDRSVSEAYMPGKGGAMLEVYARGKYLDNAQWTEYIQAHGWKGAEAAAKADGWAGVHDQKFENAVVVWDAANIKVVENARPRESRDIFNQPGSAKFDAEGKPLRLYHGSTAAFDTFDAGEFGFHFTPDEKVAEVFGDVRAFDVNVRNAFYIGKDLGNWQPEDLLNWLASREYKGPNTGIAEADKKKALAAVKKLRKQYAAALSRPNDTREYAKALYAVAAPVREMFKARGYDAIRYKNEGEGGEAYILFDPEQIKSATGNNGNFDPQNPSILEQSAKEAAADLLVQHNLSAENLLHAKRMGGIPVPSLAVTKKSAPMENFGEITLLGTKEMADPKGYAGTKVFGADIYSPRYPSVEFKLDNKAQRKLNEALAPFRKEGDREMYGGEIRRADDLTSYKPFQRWAADRYGVDENATTWQQLKASANALVREIGAGERIFQGFTYRGNRKYIDHTLDNVVKILKKELRGGENFNYGVGSLRAKFTPQFKSVAQIQKAKNRLVDKTAFEAIKKEIDAEFIALSNALDLSLEQTSEVIEDSAKMGAKRAIDRAFKDYKQAEYEATTEQAIAAGDFARKLTTLPTEYFEAKILRAVDVAEFAAAVVPVNASQEVLDALAERGVTRIAKYNPETPGDRTAKINEFNDLFFQEKVGQPTPRGTFNPRSLELVLNPNANLSTWFHETGHFFLEVMADVASQPGAPAQIVEDFNTFLKWAGITGDEDVGGADSGVPLGQQAEDADAVYQEIAADQEMIDALEVYMVSGDPPEGALNDKLVAYLRRLPPVPADSYLTFYRNQPRGVRAWGRGWASWTTNEDQTRFFGGRDFEVLKRKGAQGINLERLGEARGRITGDYHQYGSQAEWLLLNESVGLNQDGQPTPATQPLPKRRTPLETWNAMTLDQQRPYHERWAESIEQYVMEGRAPSVELQPLMRRFAAWLKSVYGSIKRFLASRGVPVAGGDGLNQPAYHGTPYRGIEKFSTDKIGTGEGAQSYGWGLYFASKKEIAEWYRKALTRGQKKQPLKVDGKTLTTAAMRKAGETYRRLENEKKTNTPEYAQAVITAKWLDQHDTLEDARTALARQRQLEAEGKNSAGGVFPINTAYWDNLISWLDQNKSRIEYPTRGQLYEVEIPEDSEMLLWDKSLSEQPVAVREALGKIGAGDWAFQPYVKRDAAGQEVYRYLARENGNDKAASEALAALGIKGIKYLDGTSRGAGDGTYNYVVFSGDDVQIRNQFYQDPAAPAGPQMALNDDIRRVMDRMLATDEQIAQANEVAGLVPDEAADGVAEERLRKRSIADLKWAVKARDAVIAKLKKEARAIEKAIRERVTEEVDAMPEMRAKAALDALQVDTEYDGVLKAWKDQRAAAETAAREEVKAALLADNPDAQGLAKGQLLMKNKRDLDNKVDAAMIKWDAANPRPSKARYANDQDLATVADSFGYESVDAMLQAVDAFDRRDLIGGMTEQRMLEEHGDLVDERAIQEAANEAVHNEARARSLATELRTQAEMLGARTDTGETTATGRRVTVNALVEAAKQFAANVVGKTSLRDLKAKAWQHTAAERRAARRWTEATAAGKTEEAVKAKQDQMLNHAAAKAAIDAQAEAREILDFFARVTKGNDETVVEKGRDADLVNAARAVLAAYGVQTPASKGAEAYLESLAKHDPETYNVVKPMVDAATQNAQPLEALTFDELQALHEEVQAMWFLAKRTRQMEVDGDLLDIDDVAQELYARMEEIGIPDEVPGERGALTRGELLARQWLQQAPALLRRVEQWAEAKDGKFGGPFLRFIFQPVKDAADRYRTARLEYRKKFQSLVDNIAPMMTPGTIDAPELGYVFGRGHNGGGMAELLHAIAHTGNESNKRKLLLGRQWATELPDGTLDTGRWDAFIQRLANEGRLQREHFDFVQGVWDLLEETKPLAQKTHREVFGRYFAEVTADAFVDPFGVQRRGGYIPAQADPLLVQDADLRDLLETENVAMSQAFPQTNRGFTKSRVEYNRPLKLDLRTLPQHIDKVLLFAHMEPAVRGVARVLRRPKVSQPLARIDPAAMGAMLKPWLNRSARQTVETPISADAGLNRMASAVRGRVGMALMFANVSNTLQQITGSLTASIKVKPGLMMRATAQFIANPKKFKQSVWDISPYMADRAANEVAVLSDTLDKILVNPSVWQSAEHFTRRHAYFLQIAFDNQISPIIWSAAYNQALADGVDERMAVRFADGVIRQTQGSTLPEDVSHIETGPAYARLFTQFMSYFNMMANTNATAIQQIAAEQGLRKGAGKAFYTLLLGLLAPIWVAEAIANAMRGGPDDEDDDGWLDDWLAAVFGFGTIRGLLSGVPFLGAVGQSVVNRFNRQPADDKFSLSPTVSVLESAAGAPASVYKAIVEDKSKQRAVRDTAALITVLTGLPAMAVARPLGYAAGMADDRIDPTGAGDLARGLITGTASPESRTP